MKNFRFVPFVLLALSGCYSVTPRQNQVVVRGKVLMPGGSPQQIAWNQEIFLCAHLDGTLAGHGTRMRSFHCAPVITDREGNYSILAGLKITGAHYFGDADDAVEDIRVDLDDAKLYLAYGEMELRNGVPTPKRDDGELLTMVDIASVETKDRSIVIDADVVVGDLRHFVPRKPQPSRPRPPESGGNRSTNGNTNTNTNSNTIIIQPRS